ncbi:hypothetical protein AGMMS49992_02350 [Clostridia bacterium]|nr:hypothetical protein AGMMS49992_02350 [Clostridia bacterium]
MLVIVTILFVVFTVTFEEGAEVVVGIVVNGVVGHVKFAANGSAAPIV